MYVEHRVDHVRAEATCEKRDYTTPFFALKYNIIVPWSGLTGGGRKEGTRGDIVGLLV